MNPVEVATILCDEIRPIVHRFLHLEVNPAGYEITQNGSLGLLSIDVESAVSSPGTFRIAGNVTVDVVPGAWRNDFVAAQKDGCCQRGSETMDAGRYIVAGLKVSSSVEMPALNTEAMTAIYRLDRALGFARAIENTRMLVVDLLSNRQAKAGLLLKSEGERR